MKINSFEGLPFMLTVEDLKNILGICRVKAYELTHKEGFPIVVIGRRRLIPKEGLIEWINKEGGIRDE